MKAPFKTGPKITLKDVALATARSDPDAIKVVVTQ